MIYLEQEVIQGTDFFLPLNWQYELNYQSYTQDISGFIFEFKVKESVNTPNPPLVDVSTVNGGIVLNGPAGQANIYITNAVTATLPIGRWFYTLYSTNTAGLIEVLLMGPFTVKEAA